MDDMDPLDGIDEATRVAIGAERRAEARRRLGSITAATAVVSAVAVAGIAWADASSGSPATQPVRSGSATDGSGTTSGTAPHHGQRRQVTAPTTQQNAGPPAATSGGS